MTVELLTLIALWCGNPVNATKGAMDFKTGTDISIEDVNQCREALIKCVNTPQIAERKKFGGPIVITGKSLEECFEQTKYAGKDN